jgi:hypothetical protein
MSTKNIDSPKANEEDCRRQPGGRDERSERVKSSPVCFAPETFRRSMCPMPPTAGGSGEPETDCRNGSPEGCGSGSRSNQRDPRPLPRSHRRGGRPSARTGAHPEIAHVRPVHRQNRSRPHFPREKHLPLLPVFQPLLPHPALERMFLFGEIVKLNFKA